MKLNKRKFIKGLFLGFLFYLLLVGIVFLLGLPYFPGFYWLLIFGIVGGLLFSFKNKVEK